MKLESWELLVTGLYPSILDSGAPAACFGTLPTVFTSFRPFLGRITCLGCRGYSPNYTPNTSIVRPPPPRVQNLNPRLSDLSSHLFVRARSRMYIWRHNGPTTCPSLSKVFGSMPRRHYFDFILHPKLSDNPSHVLKNLYPSVTVYPHLFTWGAGECTFQATIPHFSKSAGCTRLPLPFR